jgi:dinuclear metal center YbgI/SA1388 family protein
VCSLEQVCGELSKIAPLQLAESWDNVGLLVGDRTQRISRVITCLTITPSVVNEALELSADLVVTHHPLPFRPIQRLTSDQVSTSLLLKLIRAGVAVYSAHTAFDSAASGVNQMWADSLNLVNVRPLVDLPEALTTAKEGSSPASAVVLGSGRYGDLPVPIPFGELARRASQVGNASSPQVVGPVDRLVSRVAIACGSGGSFVSAAKHRGCDAMVTGEATFHQCLEAEALEICLALLGHYASERFSMEVLAVRLSEVLPNLQVWPSREERDPIRPLT